MQISSCLSCIFKIYSDQLFKEITEEDLWADFKDLSLQQEPVGLVVSAPSIEEEEESFTWQHKVSKVLHNKSI